MGRSPDHGAVTQKKWRVHTTKVVLQSEDIDFLGHLNNISYAKFFERTRWEMLYERNFGLAAMTQAGRAPVILQSEIHYLREVTLADRIEIRSWTHEFQRKFCLFRQEMVSGGEVVHSRCFTKIGMIDLQSRRLIDPDRRWRAVCGEVQAEPAS